MDDRRRRGRPGRLGARLTFSLFRFTTKDTKNTKEVKGCMGKVLLVVSLVSFGMAAPARAQIFESVGIRAQGMGGAFVAIADDADAAWWNPAGLAGGAYFSAVIEYDTAQDPGHATDADGVALPAWRSGARGFTITFPSLGLSYYRLQVSQIQPFGATGANELDRQDRGRAPVLLSSLLLQQFGTTVGQSLGEHLVVGSTVRLVRGQFQTAPSAAADASLDRAADLNGQAKTDVDLDFGAMAAFNSVRFAAVVKHVTQPSFSSGSDSVELSRQARVGVSVTARGGTVGPMTFAFDADLTRTPTAVGDVRHVASGAEAWLFRRRLGVRGGLTANTVGGARASGSIGASAALRAGVYVDAHATGGSDRTTNGWGLALRVTF